MSSTRWAQRAGAVTVLAVGALLPAMATAEAAPVPYSDPSQNGSITLCNKAGQAVTSGSIHDKPFVWRAVSSTKAPAGYDGNGRVATLVAYQPRPNVAPDSWNGDTLTAGSTYTNPAHPMAAATNVDFTLADYLQEYPAQLDGFLQLRIYSGAPGVGTATDAYPTADIRVSGERWTLVGGAGLSCSVGEATSSETGPTEPVASPVVAGSSAAAPAGVAAVPGGSPTPRGSSASGTPVVAGGAATGAAVGAAARTAAADAAPTVAATAVRSTDQTTGSAPYWIGGLLVVLAVAVGGLLWRRRLSKAGDRA